MQLEYQIDNLDKEILKKLNENARIPYAELAKLLNVSPSTIHVRIEKMRNNNIITGTTVRINQKKLGFDVICFIGITLKTAKSYSKVIEYLNEIDEVIEAHYTTGKYNVFIKVSTKTIEDLQFVLLNKIQIIEEIQSTETLISLHESILRQNFS